MIRPFKLKTNMSYVVNFFSFQGLIVSYLYKDFGGARKTNAVPCIVYFLILLRGKCRAKVGVAFYNYYSFRKVSFLFMRFRQLLFFNIAVNKILSFVFFQFISFFRISHLILGKSQSYKMWKMVWTTIEVLHTLPLNNTVITYSKKYFQLYPTRCQFKIH